eukprot:CAMPEP_0194061330 /NCGR_PEP_ID=MMETSP0009_2-20130614/74302_1 /TAXON_ID=210454 /ORGANISM="Grammatophora oceanica, Strain CCMP 410" /LENGTH=47 /DNA_ID= /DNA_START= /DNA_END= /DNA_ORIENTATION=
MKPVFPVSHRDFGHWPIDLDGGMTLWSVPPLHVTHAHIPLAYISTTG